MRNRIAAIIVDPLSDEHDYTTIKTEKPQPYYEDGFDLTILKDTKEIDKYLYYFKGFDCIITISNDINFTPLEQSPFEIRKKWIHLDEFNKDAIINGILTTFLWNINRKRENGQKLFSIFTCTFNTDDSVLMRLYNSLKAQTYPNWNWWILDDSTNGKVDKIISKLHDHRIRMIKNVTNHGNIGFNKHIIASACDGDYLVEVDHDDELTTNCLEELDKAFQEYPDSDFVYSDDCEILNDAPIVYGDGEDTWACGEGINTEREVNGVTYRLSATPYITPYSIRTIHMQPNHVRCWKKEFYHSIDGHNYDLAVLDDMDILVKTFLHGKMTKVDKVLYIQHEGNGERGVTKDSTQSVRFGEIQRTDDYLKWRYDEEVHNRILELGFEDTAWDEESKQSILWRNHEVSNIMCNIVK